MMDSIPANHLSVSSSLIYTALEMIFVLLNITVKNIPAGDGLGHLSLKETLLLPDCAALQQSPTEARLQEQEALTAVNPTEEAAFDSIFLTQD